MFGLDNTSGVSVMPPIADKLNANPLWFTEGGGGDAPSYPGKDWFNAIQAEIVNFIVASGLTPNKTDLTQITQAVLKNIQKSASLFATDTGVANAYVCNFTPAITVRSEGAVLRFKVANANTGASTINDGVGVVSLVGGALSALQGGEMAAGGEAFIQWNSTVGTGSYVLLFCTGAALQIMPPSKPNHAVNNGQLIGSVSFFAMPSAPIGWLKANGAAISRTIYAALFSAIGTTYGTGDGSTTFNLPDLRGEFLRGYDDGKGLDSDRAFGSSQTDAIRNITGIITTDNGWMFTSFSGAFKPSGATSALTKNATTTGTTSTYAAFQFDASASVPTAPENRPVNVALLACIKY